MLRPTFQKLLNSELSHNMSDTESLDHEGSTDSLRKDTESPCFSDGGDKDHNQDQDVSGKWEQEKSVYEIQLNQLQEQLVETMLENQQLTSEIKSLKDQGVDDLKKEIEEEKKKRKKLEGQLHKHKPKRPPIPKKCHQHSAEDSSDLDFDDLSIELEAIRASNGSEVPNVVITNDEDKTVAFEREHDCVPRTHESRLLTFKIAVWNFIHERISDFMYDNDSVMQDEEEEPLAVKRLRENVSRFTNGIQPIKSFCFAVQRLFSWKNPWMTLSAFLIYMYAVWFGLFVPLVFLLAIIKLTLNFLYAKGISQKFGYYKKKDEKEEQKEEATSWSEKYQLVLQIARKVQNTLGGLADTLEKFESLFLWQHEEASKKLYTMLCIGFILSLLLSTSIFFTVIGLGLGCKMFIVTPIYNRFPKVRKRYDDIDRIWEELPTRVDLEAQRLESPEIGEKQESQPKQNNDTPENNTRQSRKQDSLADDFAKSKVDMPWDIIVFCDRFQLPATEVPLPGWQEGRRCTLLNKDSPLSNMKHGRLYLTKHFLCFERNQYHSKKNLAFHLQDITQVSKAKPLSFIPGGGMAVEIKVKDYEKPFVFGAMMARDEAYDSIMQAGKVHNLAWSKKF